MKIITYNTQQGRAVELFNSLRNIFEMKADFYTLQEVDFKVKSIINEVLDLENYSIIS
jgi:endonuclease/exonuclease/phosphatase family metal-dependent hydrolase